MGPNYFPFILVMQEKFIFNNWVPQIKPTQFLVFDCEAIVVLIVTIFFCILSNYCKFLSSENVAFNTKFEFLIVICLPKKISKYTCMTSITRSRNLSRFLPSVYHSVYDGYFWFRINKEVVTKKEENNFFLHRSIKPPVKRSGSTFIN